MQKLSKDFWEIVEMCFDESGFFKKDETTVNKYGETIKLNLKLIEKALDNRYLVSKNDVIESLESSAKMFDYSCEWLSDSVCNINIMCCNCGNKTEHPVEVDSEPSSIWCLECADNNGVSFSTPKEFVCSEDLKDAKSNWGCSIEEAYERKENGEDWQNNEEEVED